MFYFPVLTVPPLTWKYFFKQTEVIRNNDDKSVGECLLSATSGWVLGYGQKADRASPQFRPSRKNTLAKRGHKNNILSALGERKLGDGGVGYCGGAGTHCPTHKEANTMVPALRKRVHHKVGLARRQAARLIDLTPRSRVHSET